MKESDNTSPTASTGRDRIIAAVVTVVIAVAVFVLLITAALHYSPTEERVWPPVDSAELLFEGEYVKLGDVAKPVAQQAPARERSNTAEQSPETHDRTDAGPAGEEPTPPISSEQESPMKVEPKSKPANPGPSKEELARREEEKRRKEEAGRISKRVSFGASKSSGKTGEGTPGSPNGNADHGALSGAPGTSLSGRTLESWSKPSGRATGKIVISVRVNRQGKVVGASYRSGSGAVASLTAARQSCVQAALNSRFSVSLDAPAEQTGTIAYNFD